jgi:pyruvate,water dikinase
MVVIIQELIDFDVSGVILTCDPINGNQRKLLITSNYGIGEVINIKNIGYKLIYFTI